MTKFTDNERLSLTQSLFTSASWKLIPDLLDSMEHEALEGIRNDKGSTGEHVTMIKLVETFRNTLRALARGAGVKYD